MDVAIRKQKRKNDALDEQIAEYKIQIDNKNFEKDFLIHEKDIISRRERYKSEYLDWRELAIDDKIVCFRMRKIVQRTHLMQKIKLQHSKILERAALLELQQLRSFPTLN